MIRPCAASLAVAILAAGLERDSNAVPPDQVQLEGIAEFRAVAHARCGKSRTGSRRTRREVAYCRCYAGSGWHTPWSWSKCDDECAFSRPSCRTCGRKLLRGGEVRSQDPVLRTWCG